MHKLPNQRNPITCKRKMRDRNLIRTEETIEDEIVKKQVYEGKVKDVKGSGTAKRFSFHPAPHVNV